jgi:GT2 family glycosyltransferase
MIESVYYQDYRNLMLVIVDNGSRDKTADYVSKLLNEYSGIEYYVIRLPKNYGYTGGNNRGATYSINRGAEYLFFMNDDVILLDKNLITVLVKSLEIDKRLVLYNHSLLIGMDQLIADLG